jgi:hypothetical protein
MLWFLIGYRRGLVLPFLRFLLRRLVGVCLRRLGFSLFLWCWPFLALLLVWLGLVLVVCLRCWPFLALLSVY